MNERKGFINRIYRKKDIEKVKQKIKQFGVSKKFDEEYFLNFRLYTTILVFFVSFIFLENHKIGGSKDALIAMIFTVVYGIIVVALNIFKIMNGPYPFLRVYEQSLLMSIMWVILMNGSAYLLNLFMAYLTKLVNKKNI